MNAPLLNVLYGDILDPQEELSVFIKASPFQDKANEIKVPLGISLQEIFEDYIVPHDMRISLRAVSISLNGHKIERALWPRIRPKKGVLIGAVCVPRGSKIWKAIALVAVTIVAALVAGPAGALIAESAFGAALGISSTFASLAVGGILTIAGQYAVNALFPVARPDNSIAQLSSGTNFDPVSSIGGYSSATDSTSRSPSYSIGGAKNEARLYGVNPLILGRHRMSPMYAAKPYTEIVGDDQYLRLLFQWGYGPVDIDSLKIGETPITSFEGVEYETFVNYTGGNIPIFPGAVYETQLAVELTTTYGGWVQRTTVEDIDEFSLDFVWPNGIYRYVTATGERQAYNDYHNIEYRKTGTTAWTGVSSVAVYLSTPNSIRRTVRLIVPKGQYDVRVKKGLPQYVGVDTVIESCAWTAIRSVKNISSLKPEKPIAITALRIKATAQLSGTIDTFNGVVSCLVKSWNGTSWVDGQRTSNPADLLRHVWQCSANADPVLDEELDLVAIQRWADYCKARGYEYNQIRDFRKSVKDTVRDIAAAGRARCVETNGLYGVIWDEGSQIVKAHFTPDNSWGFESTRDFIDIPHAFRIRFVNEEKSFLQDEMFVYDDGYTVENAKMFESLEFPGVTKPSTIYKHGRYHLASLRLRREQYVLSSNFEHFICGQGDLVSVANPVTKWGKETGRVTGVAGQVITLNKPISLENGKNYSMRFQLDSGASVVRAIAPLLGSTQTITLTGSGLLPAHGDVFLFGETGLESAMCRVVAIDPIGELDAKIYLVDDAPGIQFADTGPIPPFNSNISVPVDLRTFSPKSLTSIEEFTLDSGDPKVRLKLSWASPDGASPIYYVAQYRQIVNGATDWSQLQVAQKDERSIGFVDLSSGVYEFRIKSMFSSGISSDWAVLPSVTLSLASQPPGDVQSFNIVTSGDTSTLSWPAVSGVNIKSYLIKFSPSVALTATWQGSATLAETTATTAQVSAQVGTYFIKALTYQGQESINAVRVVTNVASQTNFNSVESFTQGPVWPGSFENCLNVGAELQLNSLGDIYSLTDIYAVADIYSFVGVNSLGYYYTERTIDLIDVYSCRISAILNAYGFNTTNDIYALSDIYSVADIYGAAPSQWDVTIEARYTVENPALTTAIWSAWSPLTVGNISGRAFQFRVKMESFQPNITPVVTSLTITVDMPDRIEGGNAINVPASGLSISFVPPFRKLLGFSTADQGLLTGYYSQITAKTESGFTVQYFNASGVPVAGQISYTATGYGRVQ
jgi:hypothetical protein